MTSDKLEPAPAGSLAVLVHAYQKGPSSLKAIRVVMEDAGYTVWAPQLPLSTFSLSNPEDIAAKVHSGLVKRVEDGKYTNIVIIGHSCGALIARRLYLLTLANSETSNLAARISRLVLMAGMNRGWSISPHMNPLTGLGFSIGAALVHWVTAITGHLPLISQIRRGAPFITRLRLDWLELAGRLKSQGKSMVTTVQLLGTIDDLVSPEDNIDLVTGKDFYYIDVAHSNHPKVVRLDDRKTSPAMVNGQIEEVSHGKVRTQALCNALSQDQKILDKFRQLPVDETAAEMTAENVKDVVFVIHGIRDEAFWTHKLARRIMTMGNNGATPPVYASETSKYGYFPMLGFLMPHLRRQKVEWLMDQYVEARALYPKADFSYVGHSHGTYMLARALQDYPHPYCVFKNVVFAGSVVRHAYDWQAAIRNKQVGAVLNYVATGDWVVALFPNLFEQIPIQDLGAAGHLGFRQARVQNGVAPVGIFQRSYVKGDHSAALKEENWTDIADFIVNGALPKSTCNQPVKWQAWWLWPFGLVPWAVWAAGLTAIGWLFVLIWGYMPALPEAWLPQLDHDGNLMALGGAKTLATIGLSGLLWRILTRV